MFPKLNIQVIVDSKPRNFTFNHLKDGGKLRIDIKLFLWDLIPPNSIGLAPALEFLMEREQAFQGIDFWVEKFYAKGWTLGNGLNRAKARAVLRQTIARNPEKFRKTERDAYGLVSWK